MSSSSVHDLGSIELILVVSGRYFFEIFFLLRHRSLPVCNTGARVIEREEGEFFSN